MNRRRWKEVYWAVGLLAAFVVLMFIISRLV